MKNKQLNRAADPSPAPVALSKGEAQHRVEQIQRYQGRMEKRNPARFKKDELTQTFIPDGDPVLNRVGIADAFGTADDNFAKLMLNQISNAHPSDEAPVVNSAITAASGIKPQDELEGMLAAQMVAAHNLAMEFLARASKITDNPELVTQNIERATKLMRTFTAQVEALNRYRGKGQQKMTVEHVHVHEGGQAIVGVVDAPLAGSRDKGGPS